MSALQERPPAPTAAAIAIAAALIAGTIGYFLGTASSIFTLTSPQSLSIKSRKTSKGVSEEPHSSDSDQDDDEDEDETGELRTFADSTEECKLVLVVRTDLGMTKGLNP